MKLKISEVRRAQDDEWDDTWLGCEYATYFHSREWAETWHAYTEGMMCPDPRLVVFSDNKKALLPLSYQRSFRGLTKDYVFSPAGTFGGWISCQDLSKEHAVLLVRYLNRKIKNLTWRLNPYDPHVFAVGLPVYKKEKTQVLNLEKGFDDLWLQWKKKHDTVIRNARKAEKAGIAIKQAAGLEEWQFYYDIYADSLQRWGDQASSRYDWEIFHYMFQKKSPYIKLWLAYYRDTAAAGALCFYSQKHAVYWHGAALETFFNLRPVNLMMVEIIKDACKNGFKWFDFNPSGGHEGVWRFKKSFGPREMDCPMISSTGPWQRFLMVLGKLKGKIRRR